MNALLSLWSRPLLYWFAVPFVVTLGLFLGITSASAEEARSLPPLATPTEAATPAPTRPGPTTAPVRPGVTAVPVRPNATPAPLARLLAQAQSFTGRIAAFDLRNQAIIVQARGDKYITVHIEPTTIAKLGDTRVRLGSMRVGDVVVVLGRRTPTGEINAALITIKPRAPAK